MALFELMTALKKLLETVVDSSTKKPFFDQVWFGMPHKIPMGSSCVSILEITNEPAFYYTTCPTNTQSDVDIAITILRKGDVEIAHSNLYKVTDAVKELLYSNDTISETCIAAMIENIEYGDISMAEKKYIATSARITLKCRLQNIR